MKVTVIKFGVMAIEEVDRVLGDYEDSVIVAVGDPDVNGRVLAQHELPEVECYADVSLAIRESGCNTVLLTISDHAPQLALLAMSYKKDVFLAKGVDLGEYRDRVLALAKHTKKAVEYL